MDHLKPLLPHTSCLPQTKKKSNVEHCDKNESHALGKEDGLTCRALGKGRAYVSCLGKGTGLRVGSNLTHWQHKACPCRHGNPRPTKGVRCLSCDRGNLIKLKHIASVAAPAIPSCRLSPAPQSHSATPTRV